MVEFPYELALTAEISRFFYEEADLLDERRMDDWLACFTDDARYWMPLVRNVHFESQPLEYSAEGKETAWIDEGVETLKQRVKQLSTGMHWVEEPRSRVSHAITNIRVTEATPDHRAPETVRTSSRFIVYLNRVQTEHVLFVGKRRDVLRRVDGGWKVARREVYLDQNVLLAKALTTFF